MPEQTSEALLKRALVEGRLKLQGEGKAERIIYVADNNHSEKWTDPEEKIRAAFYAELIYKYEYNPSRIGVEITVPRRTPSDRADLVVYKDDERKEPFAVIECKRDGISQAEFLQAIEQACGNCASLRASYAGTVAGITRRFLDFRKHPSLEREKNIAADLPKNYTDAPEYRFYKGVPGKDLYAVSRDQLRTTIRKCHQTLWEGGRRSPIVAFGEFSKIIFIKIRDEKITDEGKPYAFQRRTSESSNEDLAARIHILYKAEQAREPDVFPEKINVDASVLAQVVEHIESIDFNHTDLDTKGVAFEEFMSGFFKGDFGQYFTPRELIAFAVHMLPPSPEQLVIDPACGSGGFLLHSLDYVRTLADRKYPNYRTDIKQVLPHREYWHNFAEHHLFGIEINEELSRVAKMSMIVHDDGHTNIVGHDALDFFPALEQKKPKLQANQFDLVLTNPPFGSVVKEAEKGKDFLSQFELRQYLNKSTTGVDSDESAQGEQSAKRGAKAVKLRASIKTEILFLERVWSFLKPETGKAAVIVPDGILTNASLQGVRDWLMKRFQILGVVSLPQFAFQHYDAGVKASIIFLRKRGDDEQPNDDEAIFMAQAENIGYGATGRQTFKTTLESEQAGIQRVLRQSCDLFDYRVYYEWSTANPKSPVWSEYHREVIPETGIVAQFHQFQQDATSFFV
jgi:type I restriction enzyme M protein